MTGGSDPPDGKVAGRVFPTRRQGAPPFKPYPQADWFEGWRCGACWCRVNTHEPIREAAPGISRLVQRCQSCEAYCDTASCNASLLGALRHWLKGP